MRSGTHVVNMALVQPVCGFSTQGEYFAFCGPDGTVKIYDTAARTLKQDYTPSSHLSTICCCLAWSPTGSGHVSPRKKKKKLRKSLESNIGEGPDHIGIGTSSGSVLIYSLLKGDLLSVLDEDGHTNTVNGVCWSQDGSTLYSCSSDQHIAQWDLSTATVKQKWKGDKGCIYSVCLCQNENYLLSAGRVIKMWDLQTLTAVKTFTGHATEIFRLLMVPSFSNGTESDGLPSCYFLSAAVNDRLIHVWNTQSTRKAALASFSIPDEPIQLAINRPVKDQTLQLAVTTKSGDLQVYEHGLNGPMKKPIQPKSTIQVATDGDSPRPIPVQSAHFCGDMTQKILYTHGTYLKLNFEKSNIDSLDLQMCLVRTDPNKIPLQVETSVSKVKTPQTKWDATVLAPGHMAPAGPSRQDSTDKPGKKKRRKSASGEMSLDDRLNAISIEKPAEQKDTQPPKVDTLATLLTQGLRSKDKTILVNVFGHQSEGIIRNTVRRLPVAVIVPLVQELSKRIHGNIQGGQNLVKWLKCVLTVHTAYLMAFPELVGTLSKLYQMMESRTALFGRLSRLQGKLDLMLSQVSAQTEEEEVITSQPPMLVYHDESSDEEAYGGDLVPYISESEDEWNADESDGEQEDNGEGQNGEMEVDEGEDSSTGNQASEEEESMESDAGE